MESETFTRHAMISEEGDDVCAETEKAEEHTPTNEDERHSSDGQQQQQLQPTLAVTVDDDEQDHVTHDVTETTQQHIDANDDDDQSSAAAAVGVEDDDAGRTTMHDVDLTPHDHTTCAPPPPPVAAVPLVVPCPVREDGASVDVDAVRQLFACADRLAPRTLAEQLSLLTATLKRSLSNLYA